MKATVNDLYFRMLSMYSTDQLNESEELRTVFQFLQLGMGWRNGMFLPQPSPRLGNLITKYLTIKKQVA